jgi:hypothetical protein
VGPLIKSQLLYQLSYAPAGRPAIRPREAGFVANGGLLVERFLTTRSYVVGGAAPADVNIAVNMDAEDQSKAE